jgi:hypothetical protein
MKRLLLLLALVGATTSGLFGQANIWNCIVPLHSTRQEVEKRLGAPLQISKALHSAQYQTKTEKVFVLYSTGSCDKHPNNGWRVPEMTVISVHVYPLIETLVSDLKLDYRKFEKRADPEIGQLFYYTNEADGISVSVNGPEEHVSSVGYFPEGKDYQLKCKNQ